MKKVRTARYIILFLSIIVASNTCYGQGRGHTYGSFLNVQYVKNYDGDTITFDIPGVPPIIGNDMVIRVRGIDTPELKRNTCRAEIVKGRQAKKLVRSILRRAKTINLHRVGRGKYFRFVADVEVDGKNLADILIKNGLAVPYDGGKKTHDWCAGSIFDGLFSAMGLPPP